MAGLVPRVYQAEAAREALRENKIIRADTGTGKTLIAILLIKQASATSNKWIVFLSPNVTLVHQQAAAIEAATSLKVTTFVGADGVDYWNMDRWVKQIRDCDVGVMTPQVFLNLSDNAYWKLEDISLVIFDECHHASKNHPCARVMRNHYHPLKSKQSSLCPRILGLTASPIYNVKKPEKLINDLESTLDAKILEISAFNSESMAAVSQRADERLIEHAPIGTQAPLSAPYEDMLRKIAANGNLDSGIANRAAGCEQLFGRVGLDIYISLLAEESGMHDALVHELEAKIASGIHTTLSHKVVALVECLVEFQRQPHFHSIVFVRQRHHAKILQKILSLLPALSWIKAGYLTGHGVGKRDMDEEGESVRMRAAGMVIKEQQETVRKFRNEEYNLLVATQVAEEGLDFSSCNVVIRFDALETITGYIQSRGRARASNALFVVLAEVGSEDAARYRRYVEQETDLKRLYAERPEEEVAEPELENLPTYSTSTGALLTYRSAIPTLANFCSLLNKIDQFTTQQKPTYQILDAQAPYRYELVLPRIAALPQQTFVSDSQPTKKAARQQTAFECCVALHKAGALNEHLLPIRESSSIGAKDAHGRTVERNYGPKEYQVHAYNPFGNVWLSDRAFLHIVEIGDQRLGLLCAIRQAELANGQLYRLDNTEVGVRMVEVHEIVWSSKEDRESSLTILQNFNTECVKVQLNRKIEDDKQNFFALWAPVTLDGRVDLAAVEHAFLPFDPARASPESIIVVPCRRPRGRIGLFKRIRDDVTSLSSTSAIELDPPKHKKKVVEKYDNYRHYLKVVYDHGGLEAAESEERIIEFEPMQFSPFHLARVPPSAVHTDANSIRRFPSSMCRISGLSLEFWQVFAMTPALNRLLSTRTIAKYAIERLDLPRTLDIDRVAMSLTAPVSNTGIDYEHLETLGDSLLKLATSVHVYLEFPKSEESRLTTLRMNSVDNRFLRQQCIQVGLDAFVQGYALRWGTFVPEAFDSLGVSDDGSIITRKIGRKSLADVVEAVVGAAVVTQGLSLALATGDKLGLCFGGSTPWNARPSAKQLVDVEPVRVAHSLRFIEQALGYEIKTQGRLFVQALTHRSFPGEGHCYEREEYLGDGLIDYWATVRLFALPTSTPRFLTFRRAMLVSNSTLSLLAIRKLRLHKSILHNSPLLDKAIQRAVEYADKIDWKDVLEGDLTWIFSPPKVLGDVVEALMTVVFIDSNFNLDTVFAALDKLYEDILPYLDSEQERRDPYSRWLMWRDSHSCDQLKLELARSNAPIVAGDSASPLYTSTVTFHSTQIAYQAVGSKTVARQLAARQALESLESGQGLKCECRARKLREKQERMLEVHAEPEVAEMDMVEDEDTIEGKEISSIAEIMANSLALSQDDEDEQDTQAEDEAQEERVLAGRIREY